MERIAYIDESGTDGMALDKSGNTQFYVLTAIVLTGDQIRQAEHHFGDVRTKYFRQSPEMRSHLLRNRFDRRQQVLTELMRPGFQLYILVVDKRNLKSPGYLYPSSFTKNLHDKLYQELRRDAGGISVVADQLKTNAFMEDFRQYVDRRHSGNLFQPWSFRFVDSRDEVCVQAADVIAGSIAWCSESPDRHSEKRRIHEIISGRVTLLQEFPNPMRPYVVAAADIPSSEYDAAIEDRAIEEALKYIQGSNDDGDANEVARVNVLQSLMTAVRLDPERWVSTRELCAVHEERFAEPLAEQRLRTSLVAVMRDRGVLIASRRAGGYKLPIGLADMVEFVNTQSEKVIPMLSRLRKARQVVVRATRNQVDILGSDEFAILRDVLDRFQQ